MDADCPSHGDAAPTAVQRGRVKLFSLERGYGFISPEGGGADVYVWGCVCQLALWLVRGWQLAVYAHFAVDARGGWVFGAGDLY
jgi:hypothetical protein